MEWFASNLGWILNATITAGAILLAFGGIREKIYNLDKKVDELEKAFVQLARQDERMNSMDQRMLAQGKRLDRLEYVRWQTKEKTEGN